MMSFFFWWSWWNSYG